MNLIPDIQGKYEDLFLEFLSEPGVLDRLKDIVREVKSNPVDLTKESFQDLPPRSPRPSSVTASTRRLKRTKGRSVLTTEGSSPSSSISPACKQSDPASELSEKIAPNNDLKDAEHIVSSEEQIASNGKPSEQLAPDIEHSELLTQSTKSPEPCRAFSQEITQSVSSSGDDPKPTSPSSSLRKSLVPSVSYKEPPEPDTYSTSATLKESSELVNSSLKPSAATPSKRPVTQTKALLDDIHNVLTNLQNVSVDNATDEKPSVSEPNKLGSVNEHLNVFTFTEKPTVDVDVNDNHGIDTYEFRDSINREITETDFHERDTPTPNNASFDVEDTLQNIEASLSCLSLLETEISRMSSSPRESTPLPTSASSRIYLGDDVCLTPPSVDGYGANGEEPILEQPKPAHSRTLAKLIIRRPKSRTSEELKNKSTPVHIECNSDCDHTMEAGVQIAPFYQPIIPVSVLPTVFVITIQEFFNKISGVLTIDDAGDLCEELGFPYFLRTSLFAAFNKDLSSSFTCTEFLACYQAKSLFLIEVDLAEAIFNIISWFGKDKLIRPENLLTIIQDLTRCHPCLEFFRQGCDERMEKYYSSTVLTSIFYSGDGWARKCLSLQQFKRSNFLDRFNQVHEEEDISTVEHFSYDQFYVLYRKFLDLDLNRDDLIDKREIMNYDENSVLTKRVINRIFSVNLSNSPKGLMTYEDFVVFVKADVDKRSRSSIHYWFNVLDIDNDGYVGIQDLYTFYKDSLYLYIYMDNLDMDNQIIPFDDLITQLLDSTCPSHHLQLKSWGSRSSASRLLDSLENPRFSLKDLQKSPSFPHLVDAFVNISRFIINDETSDVVARYRNSTWETFLGRAMADMDADE